MRVNRFLAAGAKAVGGTLVRQTEGNLRNAYLGIREGWGMKIAAPAVGLGYMALPAMDTEGIVFHNRVKWSSAEYVGTPPMMNAEGVNNSVLESTTGAPTLSASGDLVLGLHRSRRG